MSAETVLKESFKAIGKEYGYENVDAEFASFKELKIKWQRAKGRADFKISDYLIDADKEVLDEIARTLFSRISGSDARYPETMSRWMTSSDFIEKKQPIYLKRSRNITRSTKGNKRDLVDSYDRLIKMGLIKEDPDVHMTWTKGPNIRRVGYCSVLMKVIAISSVFDSDMIPEFVLDYVLYHEFIHIMAGFNPFGRKHGPEFTREEKKFPRRAEAEEWLKKLCLYL